MGNFAAHSQRVTRQTMPNSTKFSNFQAIFCENSAILAKKWRNSGPISTGLPRRANLRTVYLSQSFPGVKQGGIKREVKRGEGVKEGTESEGERGGENEGKRVGGQGREIALKKPWLWHPYDLWCSWVACDSKVLVSVRSGPGKPNQRKVSSWTFPRGAFRNKSSMWIVLVFLRKNTRIHKNGRNSWTSRFGPLFGLVCRGDSWSRPRNPGTAVTLTKSTINIAGAKLGVVRSLVFFSQVPTIRTPPANTIPPNEELRSFVRMVRGWRSPIVAAVELSFFGAFLRQPFRVADVRVFGSWCPLPPQRAQPY